MREPAGPNPLPDGLAEALDHMGRLRWDQYMELALYAPASGFFATDGRAGRRGGDFITSPEVGPTFGAVIANHLDRLWERLGHPVPFTVVEGGAGRGALAIAVRAAQPACTPALHWVMVERSASLRAEQGDHLELAAFDAVQGDVTGAAVGVPVADRPVSDPEGLPRGPWFSSLAEMPTGPVVGAVVANELLDNLPFRLLERVEETWREVMVTIDDSVLSGDHPEERATDAGTERSLTEEHADVPAIVGEAFDEVVPDAAPGTRVPWQPGSGKWVTDAIALVERGEVLVFDYAQTTAALAGRPQHEWLRTYRAHERGVDPLQAPGSQDITVEVAMDQLPPPDQVATQAEWLVENGLDDLVEAASQLWEERAGVGDLEAIRARSVAGEAAALTDPGGMGAFSVLTWRIAGEAAVAPAPPPM